jgi:glycosyltransferase involved in cell wall biosynthesis
LGESPRPEQLELKTATESTEQLNQSTPVDRQVELSVVMPCLNEARTVGTCVRKALEAMDRLGVEGEVVVADNGSTDGSIDIARSLGARVVTVAAQGYGSALQAGCQAARGRYILMGDADDSYDFSRIEGFVDNLRQGDELVIGTRLKGRIMPGAMPWLNRHIGNPMLTAVLRTLFGANISDAYCGMRGFTKDAFERMDLRSRGMEFALEMLIKSSKLGLRVSEVPITLHPDGRGRPPHLRPWRDGWRTMKLMLLFSPKVLFLVPGLMLFALGLLFLASQLLAPWDDPLRVFGYRLDFHWAILGSFLLLVGYQLTIVHFFARVYSLTHQLQQRDRLVATAIRFLTLGRVLALSAAAVVVGLVLDVIVVTRWLSTDFGALVSGYTRLFIFGSTLLALGIQTFFNAFFFSILSEEYRYRRADHAELPQSTGPSND